MSIGIRMMPSSTSTFYMAIAMCLYFAIAVLSSAIPSSAAIISATTNSHSVNPRQYDASYKKRHCRHSFAHLFGFGSCIVGPENSESTGITEDLLQRFHLMAQYSQAAYCPGNNNRSGTPITCSNGNCPLVEAAGAHGEFEFENSLWTDDTGFLAIDKVNRLIVLSFRGSESIANWKVDVHFIRHPTDLCKHCHVHSGFWKAWTEIRDRAKAKVLKAIEKFPEYRFAITGHSLGGAIATLAAGDFRKLNDDLAVRTELYTFGSPRIGNGHTAAFLTDQSDLSFRVTSMSDPVPREPGHVFGYKHTSPEFWIYNHPENPSPNDVKVLTGFYNKKGNSGKHGLKFAWHRKYFGPITKCRDEEDNSS